MDYLDPPKNERQCSAVSEIASWIFGDTVCAAAGSWLTACVLGLLWTVCVGGLKSICRSPRLTLECVDGV